MTATADVATTLQARGYVATWSVRDSGDDLPGRVADQFESWLRSKKLNWDPPLDESGLFSGPGGQQLVVVHRRGADGHSARLRLTESNDRGTWRTSLTVHAAANHEPWIRLHVSNAEGFRPQAPRLARYLVESLHLHDGATWLSSTVRQVGEAGVEEVAEEVTDADRLGLYIVAGTDETTSTPDYVDRVGTWTRNTVGLAQVVVLDSAATRAFADILGRSHEAPPGTLRTFLPDVDPALPFDGRRHRILGRERLAGSVGAVQAILGQSAFTHAAGRPLPARYVTVRKALTRAEDALLVNALFDQRPGTAVSSSPTPVVPVVPAPSPAPEDKAEPGAGALAEGVSVYLAQVELVKEVFGIPSVDRQTLDGIARALTSASSAEAIDRVSAQLAERSARIEELELERESLRETADDQELELAQSFTERARLTDEVAWLRRQLSAVSNRAAWESMPGGELTTYPEDFLQLSQRLAGLEEHGVIFTGDAAVVADLVEHDTLGRLAGVAWDCLLTLCDYVRARNAGDHASGLRQYLEQTPQGYRTVPPKKFAARESRVTMNAWGDDRRFPVPAHICPDKTTTMEAHFKLGRIGIVSPRLYYLDAYTRDGKVYVGYIGTHLRNTMSN